MATSISKGFFLRAIRQTPFVTTKTNCYFLAPVEELPSIKDGLTALKELVTDQTISFFEYIEESKVIVIETESRLASCCAKKSRDQSRRQSTFGHLWPRASVRCLETS